MAGERWSWLGDPLALDVANTVERRGQFSQELWATGTDVSTWVGLEHDRLEPVTAAEADDRLGELRQLRDAVLMLLRATAAANPWNSDDVDLVNRYLRAHAPVPQLDARCRGVVRRHLNTAVGQPRKPRPVDVLLGQMAVATLAFLDGPDRQFLGLCDAPSCGQLFLRRRENQLWCCTACGTRARVARHTQRRAQ